MLPDSANLAYLEERYTKFLDNPGSVSALWREYFQRLEKDARFGALGDGRLSDAQVPPRHGAAAPSGNGRAAAGERLTDEALRVARLQERTAMLVRNYRVRGHLLADLNPLAPPQRELPELDPATYGLTEQDLHRRVSAQSVEGADVQTLGQLLERLRNTYCRRIGVQFMHIDDIKVREWLQERMEACQNRIALSRQTQLRILTRLTDAVVFERFLRKKYLGAKTFSLEGAESLIPLLDLAIEKSASQGVEEIVLAMAHRGRLNVLANILEKNPKRIFREFEDPDPQRHRGGGDVKYHLGYSGDWKSADGKRVHLSLCFNPSHLEYVNPVALGRVRAKQDRSGDAERRRGMALLIHGDAAFAGEGVTQETLNLSQLPAYEIGGTLHVIVNNQLGFTTPPEQGRSTHYPSDVAKMLQAPIFHVNGEDPEAVAQVVDLSLEFRARFRRDVVIDMYCYRRWGHNEGDEPSFTQPAMYAAIEQRPSVRDAYLNHLLELGGVKREEADQLAAERQERLERALSEAQRDDFVPPSTELQGVWQGFHGGKEQMEDDVETGVPQPRLAQLLLALAATPDGFHPHPKLQKGMELRRQMAAGERPLDWAAGEALALATLALEGHRVRLTGQDSERGTFSHRHAVLHDAHDGSRYAVFQHLAEGQATVEICNSPLSEIGVLGFEYGYSLDCPDGLTLWEAQFGDFANAAQVIIDQFIASAADKWHRLSGLVLLLPHGFEGQGPEHSSARLERFLTLGAEDNIQVVIPTTPAQLFHVLRRQVLRNWRKPLVVLTPKSLLRDRRCVSPLEDLARGRFRRVIADAVAGTTATKPAKILLCSGKVFYDLIERRSAEKRDDVPIIRIEQLYPLPLARLADALEAYPTGTPAVWVQEEPHNMGAWKHLKLRFGERLLERFPFSVVSRAPSASPATGSHGAHELEQQDLMDRAFD